jgi:citrate lyase subunit beta/citryl-CoA lyase
MNAGVPEEAGDLFAPTERELVAFAEQGRAGADAARAAGRVALPLRFWRQHAHLTVPAPDGARALKAVAGGTEPVTRQMERLGVPAEALAERLRLPPALVAGMLAAPRQAPLVVLDGEDAQALRPDVAAQGRRTAIDVLREGAWSPTTLRFYRPPGLNAPDAARDLVTVLLGAGQGRAPDAYPLDGIVFPKIEQPEEIDWLDAALGAIEDALNLERGRIRIALLIESGWAVIQLSDLARRARGRLCALILGTADLGADLGLPDSADRHAVADWARARLVTMAGALGVPAIDGMTLEYPVADPALDAAANRERFLARMALVHQDALHARRMGMSGKWVGHPAQLLAVLLAFERDPPDIEREIRTMEAYREAEERGQGAAIIEGAMADRATDRQVRMLLRRAAAMGRLEPRRAVALGIIEARELAEAQALWEG